MPADYDDLPGGLRRPTLDYPDTWGDHCNYNFEQLDSDRIALPGTISSAVDGHEGDPDPHTQYLEQEGSNKIFVQATAPTATGVGDLWVDTSI